MNKSFINSATLFLLFFLSFSYASADKEGSAPAIEALQTPWDFGKIKKGQIHEKTFSITNSGDKPLQLERVKSCCGYNVTEISSWEIDPGKNSRITVSVDTSRKRPGKDKKEITIYSNDPVQKKIGIPVVSFIVEDEERFDILPDELIASIKNGSNDLVILDVREEIEFRDFFIPGAINFPRSMYDNDEKGFWDRMEGIGKKTKIIVCCSGGYRSAFIAKRLKEKGYTVLNLKGGFSAMKKEGFTFSHNDEDVSRRPGVSEKIYLKEAHDEYYINSKGEFIWVDVRSKEEYEDGHIDGAIHSGVNEIQDVVKSIPENKKIILYCWGPGCGASAAAWKVLVASGISPSRLKIFHDGFDGWKERGFPVSSVEQERT